MGLLLLGAAAAEAQTAATVIAINTTSVDGTYNLGDTISVNVMFSAAVTVTGTPQLALVIGTDTTPRANYASGSGTQTLVFDYEVVPGNEDTDGIRVPANALTLNGGTITASGTAANLAHVATSFSGILVDGSDPPAVSSVALTSAPGTDNTYAISDAVEATVTFSAAVDITGSPQLELDFAGTAKAAACATGTNTTTMACSYTVLRRARRSRTASAIEANKLTGGTIYGHRQHDRRRPRSQSRWGSTPTTRSTASARRSSPRAAMRRRRRPTARDGVAGVQRGHRSGQVET